MMAKFNSFPCPARIVYQPGILEECQMLVGMEVIVLGFHKLNGEGDEPIYQVAEFSIGCEEGCLEPILPKKTEQGMPDHVRKIFKMKLPAKTEIS